MWFKELTIDDVPLVGGKNASLGEMYQKLTAKGISIPNGFAITAGAYQHFLKEAGIVDKIKEVLSGVKKENVNDLKKRGSAIRDTITNAEFPENIKEIIASAYEQLSQEYSTEHVDVAVRSSATAEDAPDASFAGQQESYLNISGLDELLLATKKCMASLFTDRSISYRLDKGISLFDVSLSVVVQKMVRSDQAASGVMFTIDPESGFRHVLVINAAYGLGENIVKGSVTPDEYYVHKELLQKGFRPIVGKTIGTKERALVYTDNLKEPTKNIDVSPARRAKFALTDNEILELAGFGLAIQDHYQRPMDIEWAKDGIENKLYIVQARPETIHAAKKGNIYEEYSLKKKGKLLLEGAAIGSKIGQGKSNVILDVKDMDKFKSGEVLVTDMTDPDWEPIMRLAKAIVTDKGGRTCFGANTRILTDKGFRTIKDVVANYRHEQIMVPSLHKETLKIEWKQVVNGFRRQSNLINVNFSQTGRMQNNTIAMTPDHKVLTFQNRRLVAKEIQSIIKQEQFVLSTQKIPSPSYRWHDPRLAYLLGALWTDGCVYQSRTHGEVQFIQKETPDKKPFIQQVRLYFNQVFGYSLRANLKKVSRGQIRGHLVAGQATAFRCYSKKIAGEVSAAKSALTAQLVQAPQTFLYQFLAGVIDGDGTYNQKANRINIYCSHQTLLQNIVITCLRLNIPFTIVHNRTISNIQIVGKISEIFRYTTRVNGAYTRATIGCKLLSAKQLLADIKYKVNYQGKILSYINKNLLIDSDKIVNRLVPMIKGQPENHQLTNISHSDLHMLRASQEKDLGQNDVYNITVADNHNYLVFTERYTPIIVKNCHAAIISRELGIPCIVGTGEATATLKTGDEVTVSCAEGEEGKVYEGILPIDIAKADLSKFKMPRTKIMMNVGVPREAFALALVPNSGVGLAREEFIIANFIKIHPLALLNYPKLKDKEAIKKIDTITKGYDNKAQYFVDQLAWGMGRIAAAFYPNDVIVRASDFKTNEYATLIGGAEFEPEESNPMIGWRGASRYYDPKYKAAFQLECKAFKKLRDEMGFTNVKLMIPFCRTIEEGKKVIEIMAQEGLTQGENQLEIYVMVEIPSNVILAEEFAEIFDGFSIGTNDLTQLTLGLDRDSSIVSHVYNERNEAVKTLVRKAIAAAKKHNIKIGICGDAPSSFPEFAQFLVEAGIDSISLSPDAVFKTTLKILEEEAKLDQKK
ncbi:MAG: PEP/pyruvate-binding domain-containing protein [Candidatus Binatia bacterium]|nr:PEP/pyruvate-binding domain-containing protein [Candidatus Binatia bacterium]